MEPVDSWLEREMELNKSHEDILTRREALLRNSEWQLGANEAKNSNLALSWTRAKKRNQILLQKLSKAEDILKQGTNSSRTFTDLQASYWKMVEKQLPEWKQEVKKQGRSTTPR
ncbi:uncharacterized protein [Antedon mediterranea]|uniref:uncharacterized protein n=1 Tax=Antedon mediterranea TaxID=105859 RepID=UPI003AF8DA80